MIAIMSETKKPPRASPKRMVVALSFLILSVGLGYKYSYAQPSFKDCDYILAQQQLAMAFGYTFIGTMINYEGRITQLFVNLETTAWLITEVDHKSLRACIVNQGSEFINGY